jgi:hypothetical protein
MPTPTLMLPTPKQEELLHFLHTRIVQQEEKVAHLKQNAASDFEKWLDSKASLRITRSITAI